MAIEQAHTSLSDTYVKHETVTVAIDQDFIEQSVQIKEECLEYLRSNEKVEDAINPLYEAELDHCVDHEDSEEDEIKAEEIKEESSIVKKSGQLANFNNFSDVNVNTKFLLFRKNIETKTEICSEETIQEKSSEKRNG